VLWGLIKWPESTDAELAEKLSLPRSTVTTIRRRLRAGGLYFTHLIPNLAALGCEIITALYGEFHPSESSRQKKKNSWDIIDKVRKKLDYNFFTVHMNGHHASLSAAKDFHQVKQHVEKHHEVFHEEGFYSPQRHNFVLFPIRLCAIQRFFDHAPLLARHFGFSHLHEKNIKLHDLPSSPPTTSLKLNKTDRKVFYTMVSHPDENDRQIAQRLNITRQTVFTVRNRLYRNGLIRRINIPNLRALGFELLVFAHLHLSPHAPLEKRKHDIQKLLQDASHILKISGNLESILISVYRNYLHFQRSYDTLRRYYRSQGYLIEDPQIKVFPLHEDSISLEYNFAPLLGKVLEVV